MDAGFYVLVPAIPAIRDFDYRVDTFIWGGVEHPQVPGRYVWGQHVEFVEADVTEFLMRILPAGFITNEWRALCLSNHALDLLECESNGINVDWEGFSIVDAIRQILLKSIKWAVVFALHNDQIDHVYNLNIDECLVRLRENLKRDANIEGFIAIPPMPE